MASLQRPATEKGFCLFASALQPKKVKAACVDVCVCVPCAVCGEVGSFVTGSSGVKRDSRDKCC